MIRMKISRNNF